MPWDCVPFFALNGILLNICALGSFKGEYIYDHSIADAFLLDIEGRSRNAVQSLSGRSGSGIRARMQWLAAWYDEGINGMAIHRTGVWYGPLNNGFMERWALN